MKKLLSMLGIVLLLASCSDDYTDWASPMANGPEDAKTVTLAVSQAADINYEGLTDETVQLFVPVVESVDEGITEYKVVISNEDNTNSVELKADANGYVSAEELKAAVETLYGKAPTPRVLNLAITGYTTINGQAIANKGETKAKVTLTAPHISDNYYVVGGALDWGASASSKVQKFNHSSSNVYDDPVFTIRIPASFDGDGNRTDTWFAIGDDEACEAIANSNDYSKLLGTTGGNGNQSYTGNLAPRTQLSDDGSLCMPASDGAAAYKITLNMMDYTYSIEPVAPGPEIWYLVGSCIGDGSWGNAPENIGTSLFPLAYIGNDKVSYTGYFTTDGFKLIKDPGSWDNQWGQGGSGYVKNDGGSGNISVPSAGYYTVTLDYAHDVLTIEPASITPNTYAVGIAGSFNGWSFSAMTNCPNNDHLWKCELTATGDQEGKFLIDGWSVNWGATDFPSGIGEQNGPNIPIEGGNYIVIFNDITGGYNFISK